MDLGERVWEIVIEWDHFARDTIGKQFNGFLNVPFLSLDYFSSPRAAGLLAS
jgi:hypothetical protein